MRVIVGTGLIGAGLAEGAMRRGEAVLVWNRTRATAERTGAEVADSLGAAVSDVPFVHLALTADEAVDAVLPQIFAANPSVLVLDHSTCSAARTRKRAEELLASGRRYLHCPVFMNPTSCRESTGSMIVSGPTAWFEEALCVLDPMTGRVDHVGEDPGLAAATKLVGNAMIIQTVGALAEVFDLAESLGLSREAAHALVTRISPANVIGGRGRRMLEGDDTVYWSLAMARKDVGLMLESGADLAMLSALAATMDRGIEAGHGKEDLAVLGAAR